MSFCVEMQCSEIESACSPRSTVSTAGDFFLLLEAEMAQCSLRFQEELERINSGQVRLGSAHEDERIRLKSQVDEMRIKVRQLEGQLSDSAIALERMQLERDTYALKLEEQREELEAIIDRLEEENAELKNFRKQSHLEANPKVRVEDKYRRALVYIDALQSKLR
jgi:hypothetical protein